MNGNPEYHVLCCVHVRPTVAAASETSTESMSPIPTWAHCSPRDAHTDAQLWSAEPRYHCGATVAVADDDTPRVRLDVGVVLAVLVDEIVGLLLGVCDAVVVAVRVLEAVIDAVAVVDALAPRVRLGELLGVGSLKLHCSAYVPTLPEKPDTTAYTVRAVTVLRTTELPTPQKSSLPITHPNSDALPGQP